MKEKFVDNSLKILGGLAALVTLLVFYYSNVNFPFLAGMILGSFIVAGIASIIVALLIYKITPLKNIPINKVLGGALLIALIGVEADFLKQFITENKEIKDSALSLLDTYDDIREGRAPEAKSEASYDAAWAKNFAEVEKILARVHKTFQDEALRLQAKTEVLDEMLLDSLEVESLSSEQGIARTRTIINEYRELLGEQGEFIRIYQETAINAIKEMDINSSEFWEHFNASAGKNIILTEKLMKIKMEFVDVISEMVDVIENNEGHFTIEDETFVFEDPEANRKFVELAQKLFVLGEAEENIYLEVEENQEKAKEQLLKELK